MRTPGTFNRLVLVLSGLLLFQIVNSQENYSPGYVINLKGDTLFGFIDYRNWKINPDKIDFKELTENKQIIYQPTDIIEFKVKDEIYVGARVNVETSPRNTEDLNFDKAMHLQVVATFLQTIYKGRKSLYHYFNNHKDYFYIKKDTTFELLLYKRYLYMQGENTVVNENKAYLGQLDIYFQDCPEIEAKLKKTAYKQSELDNLFKFYYTCTQTDISFKKNKEKMTPVFGILAGVSLTSLSFTGSSPNHLFFTKGDLSRSVNFSAGLYCDLILPRNQRKWSIYNELFLSSYCITGAYEKHEASGNYTTANAELGYTYLKLNTLGRFRYPIGTSYLFFNGGISNGFVINETNYKNVYTKFYLEERTVEGVAIDDTKKYELGYIAGCGFSNGRFSLEARYERGSGMSNILDLTARTNRIFFLIGFRF